jgi:hypothetical protein
MTTLTQSTINKYWSYAFWLALFTIVYNFAEGLISIFFGISDETLTLFGFGVDSFIEVMSGVGILAMVLRFRQNPQTPRSHFERTALRITGTFIYSLWGWVSLPSTICLPRINPKRQYLGSSSH